MNKKKIEGYWKSEYSPQYPMPIPNQLTVTEAKKIYSLIKKIEDKCKSNSEWCNNPDWDNSKYIVQSYRGFSQSRITGERLGRSEYETPEYRFPEDFGSHYVLKHRVKPSHDFLKYIGFIQQTINP